MCLDLIIIKESKEINAERWKSGGGAPAAYEAPAGNLTRDARVAAE